MTANAEQAASWSGTTGDTWVAQQEKLDLQLGVLGSAVIDALAIKFGEKVLDVGCGAGQTSQQLAAVVGAEGKVVGVDISATLLGRARQRAPGLEFLEADAQTYRFAPASFDVIFSRFGVMFFEDPVAAFINLGKALAPGGRLGFVCWRQMALNPMMTAPMTAAAAAGVPAPPEAAPRAPGPFAFAEREYVEEILGKAGFDGIEVTPHERLIGGNDPDAALELGLVVGPLARALRENPQLREAAENAVRAGLVEYTVDNKVQFPSATWIVTARRPA